MGENQSVVSIDDIVLKPGSHSRREQGTCFMEAVAFIAREPHSDKPACVCPVLGYFARLWNDHLKDDQRQLMKPYLRLVIGTAGDGFAEARSWMVIDWSVREVLAVYCGAQNLKDFARELRDLPQICDWDSARVASKVLFALLLDLDLALDLARALALDLDLDLALVLALALARDRDLALDLDLALKKILDSGFALLDRMISLGLEARQTEWVIETTEPLVAQEA